MLKDGAGTIISGDIPESCQGDILDKLKAEVTFGEISDFVYDGYEGVFVADITSNLAGNGELTVTFDGNVFSILTEGTDFDTPSSISENTPSYIFVDVTDQPAERRDETDTAGSRVT